MSQALSVFYGLLALLLVGTCIALTIVVDVEVGQDTAEERAGRQLAFQMIWGVGAVLFLAYGAAAVGVAQRSNWGRALAFGLTTFTLATVLFVPLAIAQFIVLTRPGWVR